MRRLLFIAVVFLGVPAVASAQICEGGLSFASFPLQVGANVGVGSGFQSFGGGLAGGRNTLFGRGGVAFVNFSDIDETAVELAGSVGSEFVLDTARRARVCPSVSLAYIIGPNDSDVSTSTFGFGLGANLGFIASESDSLTIVPTGGLRFHRSTISVDIEDFDSESFSENFWSVNLGVGLHFNRNIAVTPLVIFPIGLEDSDPQFSITLTFGR